MFKIGIPSIFNVKKCHKCGVRHASVRDCIDPEGNKMYFDVVVNHKNKVVLNDTTENVKKFLKGRSDEQNSEVSVCEGETLQWFTVEAYLAR